VWNITATVRSIFRQMISLLLLGMQCDIKEGALDTDTIRAFRVPAGTALNYMQPHCTMPHAMLRAMQAFA
jgi:hypothetical protein